MQEGVIGGAIKSFGKRMESLLKVYFQNEG